MDHRQPAGENAAGAIWDASIVKVILGGASNSRDLHDLRADADDPLRQAAPRRLLHRRKVDRLARNRADDVTIHLALQEAGVMLVSATENIDETPSGMLLHGIMSTIAEFHSRNLATEVIKGMTQKVANGGTPSKAPIGYLNVRVRDELGREVRTVQLDPTGRR